MVARPAPLVEPAYVAARAERALAGARHDDELDRRIALEIVERGGDLAHHAERQRVERTRAVEGDPAGASAPLDPSFRLGRRGARHGVKPSSTMAVDRGGDLFDARHAVDIVQQPLARIIGRHGRRIAEIGFEAGLEHFGIVVLAHRQPGGLGLGSAVDDARDQLLRVDLEFDRGVELQALAGKHRVERFGLLHRARKAVEDEAVFGVRSCRCARR